MSKTSSEIILSKFLRAQNRLIVQASDLSLGTIASMVETQAIDVSPHYQRRERWNQVKQSSLIESFLLNVPVPPVYLAEDEFGRYSVVDGKQRITAISDFINKRFKLHELENFTELNGMYFSELPSELQNALRVRPYVRVVILMKQSDPNLKYEVFLRLNRGGEAMEPQEIRNVAFSGALNDAIIMAAKNEFLRKQLKIVDNKSSNYTSMLDVELVLRYLTLEPSWESFSGSMKREMDKFMGDNRNISKDEVRALVRKFQRAVEFCQKLWNGHAFQRHDVQGWRNQFLSGMYDAQMVAVSTFSATEISRIAERHTYLIQRTKALFTDPEFDTAVRTGTNTPSRIEYRIKAMIRLLKEVKG